MKVAAVDRYTGGRIYELEMEGREVERIADVSRSARLGECRAHMNDIPIQRGRSDINDTFFAAVNAGIAAAEYSNFDRENIFVCHREGCTASATNIADLRPATVTEQARAVQEGRLFGHHRFDVSCPDCAPERCYTFCPQFDGQEAR